LVLKERESEGFSTEKELESKIGVFGMIGFEKSISLSTWFSTSDLRFRYGFPLPDPESDPLVSTLRFLLGIQPLQQKDSGAKRRT